MKDIWLPGLNLHKFKNLLIIYDENTKEITTVKDVWLPGLNLHRFWRFIASFSPLLMISLNRGYFMAARGYDSYLRVLKVSLTSERSERVRDTFSTRR